MTRLLLRLPQWALTAVCVAAVLYLTLFPHPLPDNDLRLWEHTDKVVHALMMAGVVWCAALDLMRRSRSTLRPLRLRELAAITFTVILFGGAIELAQRAMELGRGADWADWAADSIGAVAAALITWRVPWPRSRR